MTNSTTQARDFIIAFAIGASAGVFCSKMTKPMSSTTTYFVKSIQSRYPIPDDELSILLNVLKLKKRSMPDYNATDARCIYFPTDWTFADHEIRCIAHTQPLFFKFNLISGCLLNHDAVACKATLAQLCKQLLPQDSLSYLPTSWLIHEIDDVPKTERLLLIAKTNRQRQSSTLIFDASKCPDL